MAYNGLPTVDEALLRRKCLSLVGPVLGSEGGRFVDLANSLDLLDDVTTLAGAARARAVPIDARKGR